jgi:hypothetical protein
MQNFSRLGVHARHCSSGLPAPVEHRRLLGAANRSRPIGGLAAPQHGDLAVRSGSNNVAPLNEFDFDVAELVFVGG